MNIDLIMNFRIAQIRSLFVALSMNQQLTSSCHVIFTFDKLKEIVNNLQEFLGQVVTEMLIYGSQNLEAN